MSGRRRRTLKGGRPDHHGHQPATNKTHSEARLLWPKVSQVAAAASQEAAQDGSYEVATLCRRRDEEEDEEVEINPRG